MAWKKLSTYPPGHPQREGAVASAYRELRGLLDLGKPVEIGVAKDGLSWGEQRSDSAGSRQLATLLYHGNIAVLRFTSGLNEAELEAFLGVLRAQPGETGGEALAARLAAAAVIHVELKRADFSLVRATTGLEALPRPQLDLWDRILRWHLEGRPELAAAAQNAGLGAVLAWVEATLAAAAEGDSPEVRQLLSRLVEAVEADLGTGFPGQGGAPGQTAGHRVRQVAELVGALPTALREPVLEAALGRLMTVDEEGSTLRALVAAVPRATFWGALGRLRASGARFPPVVAGLIDEMAPAVEEGLVVGVAATVEPIDRDVEIFRRRASPFLELPAPIAAAAPGAFELEVRTLEPRASLQRLIATLVALLAKPRLASELDGLAARLEHAYTTLLVAGQAGAAYALVLELGQLASRLAGQPRAHDGARMALERLAGARAVAVLSGAIRRASAAELDDFHRLVERLGTEPIRHLLLALGEAEDRSVRRALFNFLKQHPKAVVSVAPRVLADERWFVVRNVLSLLQDVGDARAVASAQSCLRHPDPRVRVEALKLVGRQGSAELRDDVLSMFSDSEERIVRQAVQLAGELKLAAAVPPLLELLKPLDLGGKQRELRLKALKSLGEIGDPAVLDEIKRFFTGVTPFVSPEERRAAYLSLAGYPAAARAPWVIRGARSRDPETQRACQALLAAEEPEAHG